VSALSLRRGRGFALMLAVFLIVTLAAIGVYVLTVSTGQVATASQDEQATRAYQAARAGIERGIYQVLISSNCAVPPSISFTNPGLTGFRAELTCLQVGVTETEGTASVSVYRVTSKGCNANPCSPAAPAPTYVERELQVTVAN
jgi:MSHA biogenesis protein MshP